MTYADAVRSWSAHLSSGGTTTWTAFDGGPVESGPVPHAANLELLRRVNLAGGAAPRVVEALLAVDPPGRGALDQPLTHPDAPRFGAPAVVPEELPDEELLRVAVAALVELTPTSLIETAPAARGRGRRFRVHGVPGATSAMRRSLLDHGWVEGQWRAVDLVFVVPLEEGVADLWRHRVREGAAVSWPRFWRRVMGEPRLRPRLDVADLAERVTASTKPSRVHVCVGASVADAVAVAEGVVGLTPSEPPRAAEAPVATALRARVNQVLAIAGRAGAPTAAGLDALLAVIPPAPPLRAPAFADDHVTTTTASLRDALAGGQRRAGYAVHGDLAILDSRGQDAPREVTTHQVLAAAIAVLHAADHPRSA